MEFEACHNASASGWRQWCWPDGRPAAAQPATLVRAFRIIRDEANSAQADRMEQMRKDG